MKKECTYILIPTNKNTEVFIEKNGTATCYTTTQRQTTSGGGQFIYILSDDRIKKGDWVYADLPDDHDCQIFQIDLIDKMSQLYSSKTFSTAFNLCKKIIATTNSDLWERINNEDGTLYEQNVAKISQLDIEYIISLHNGKGKEVDVEKSAYDKMTELGLDGNERDGFMACIKWMKNIIDKKFTLEDMYMLSAYVTDFIAGRKGDFITTTPKMVADYFIQSMSKQQPKSDTVAVEYEAVPNEFDNPMSNPEGLHTKDSIYEPKLENGYIVIAK